MVSKTTYEQALSELNSRMELHEHNTKIKKKDYRNLVWVTKEQGPINVGEMERQHVQNTLNWCIRKGGGPDDEKDGILYSDWIMFFTARLLDPECK